MSLQNFCTHFFLWSFCSFMVVHYAWVKQPSQNRVIASWEPAVVKPWYDASFKQ